MAAANDDSMWNADAVAAFLGGVSRRHFLERIACKPGFPTPYQLSRKVKLWYPSEVKDWVKRNRINQAA
ncbi:MAG: hypothetical protein GAK28_02409 [Luteibacter sp.]|nr:MAG: hypothetical protein GAK28_02409 [Luteibacter sp.]